MNEGFRELVGKHSTDEDTKVRGGDLRYFSRESKQIPKAVIDAGSSAASGAGSSSDTVEKIDDLTIQFNLKEPNPRFQLDHFAVKIWGSVNIVPEHIWNGVDPLTFKNYDPAQGWPVFTGPYTLETVSETEFPVDLVDGADHKMNPNGALPVLVGIDILDWHRQRLGATVQSPTSKACNGDKRILIADRQWWTVSLAGAKGCFKFECKFIVNQALLVAGPGRPKDW